MDGLPYVEDIYDLATDQLHSIFEQLTLEV